MNDWTLNCYYCGSDNLRLVDGIQQSGIGKKSYFTPFYGVQCRQCSTPKLAVKNYPDTLVLRHIRWWYFGKEYEDMPGRLPNYDEAQAQSISSRLLEIEQPEAFQSSRTINK